MDNLPFPTPKPDAITDENASVSSPLDEEERQRKALSYKRMTILFVVIALILVGLIVWEVADLMMGGRP